MVNRNRSPSYFVSFECSVVGRGGSRTALTGAVTMEQAGSYLSIFVSLLFHTYRENFDHGLHLSPVLYRAIKQLIVVKRHVSPTTLHFVL